jgi:hypothetical protein
MDCRDLYYLPFLWRPEGEMFLKPEVTRDFAARVGRRFHLDYGPRRHDRRREVLCSLAGKYLISIHNAACQTGRMREGTNLLCHDNFPDRTSKCFPQTIFVSQTFRYYVRSLRMRETVREF